MRPSWLIQRLTKSYSGKMGDLVNAFSFGGGLKNGGLSDEAMGLLSSIFAFDYMGAAEFEFGALPETLRKFAVAAEEGQVGVHTLQLKPSKVKKPYNWPKGEKLKSVPPLYILAKKEDIPEICDRIAGWAEKPYGDLKEGTRLDAALIPQHDWDHRLIGWLELDNGFFFFKDREAFTKTCELFGVQVLTTAA